MCDKVILKNGGMLIFPDCCKDQNMCNKTFDNYPNALKFVPDYQKILKYVTKLLMIILLSYNLFLIVM